ncbi:MAG: aminotransferase class V-fold PLP-dependent enzyme, partial [Proteobacteria bacterium]|nr:aminotransferase class V-fold PLP-dependent enzyme [Pseudomonadota bacterium]
DFYLEHVQNTQTSLGCFTENGTLANLTALWVARNSQFGPKEGFEGLDKEGIYAAYRAYGTERSVILVSELGHFSLKKAGGVLGIGNLNIISIGLDRDYRIDIKILKEKIYEINKSPTRTKIIAIVGIAGATETGTVDPLRQIGEICAENGIHFHVDAAWGGPVLLSEKYKHLLDGIELADSVTIDGHKQFYMPMSSGMVYFKNPCHMDSIIYHANYVNRLGSVDLGIKSLSGSREANSLILDSALKIMGSGGYALLIEHGIETAKSFAEEINNRPNLERVTPPELNILTYRICPAVIQNELGKCSDDQRRSLNERLNEINITVQRLQREAGKSFVSRTTLKTYKGRCESIVVLRCVIMNPLTDINILQDILDEQEEIYRHEFGQSF